MKKRELLELIRNTPPPFAEMQHALNKAFLTYGKELTAKNQELTLIDKPAAKKANK